MTENPAFDWEACLAELLSDLSDVQENLLDVLNKKRHGMTSNDAAAMTELQTRERELGDRLQACYQRRQDLLRRASEHGLPSASIDKLASVLPRATRDRVRPRVQDVSDRMRILQNLSVTNWVVAQRSLLHLSQLLEIIASGGRLQPTYGDGEPVNARGALVDQEA